MTELDMDSQSSSSIDSAPSSASSQTSLHSTTEEERQKSILLARQHIVDKLRTVFDNIKLHPIPADSDFFQREAIECANDKLRMAALDPISKELIAFDKALSQEDLDLINPMTDEQIEWAQDYADEFIFEA
ncbi:hypothetical protein B0H13DRAFT_2306204 [Mycena leptocephala]|nr:hypothetical protein B0H13DRAFT_2306204 [Mycena leptocephala]